jgi:hypothetical protein
MNAILVCDDVTDVAVDLFVRALDNTIFLLRIRYGNMVFHAG